jgi:hypothetical protein
MNPAATMSNRTGSAQWVRFVTGACAIDGAFGCISAFLIEKRGCALASIGFVWVRFVSRLIACPVAVTPHPAAEMPVRP